MMNILYQVSDSTTVAKNEFAKSNILGNLIVDNGALFRDKENLVEIPLSNIYKYRPERIAYEYYGDEGFFPIVLASNNLKTLLEFDPNRMNNKAYLLKSDLVKAILNI